MFYISILSSQQDMANVKQFPLQSVHQIMPTPVLLTKTAMMPTMSAALVVVEEFVKQGLKVSWSTGLSS